MNKTIKRVEKGISDLKTARTRAELTQEALASLVGTSRENISTWESGTKGLTLKTAKRLAEHLDAGAGELLTANRLSEYKKAKSSGDAAGVLLAIKALIEGVADEDLTEDGDRFLSDLADEALAFAEKSSGVVPHHEDGETYGVIEGEGRDPAGHNVGVTKAAASREAGIWPSLPGGGSVLPDPSEYDDGSDGRNIHGHRVTPLEDLDAFDDDFEEEE